MLGEVDAEGVRDLASLDRITDAVMMDEAVPDRGLDPADLELAELVGRGILGD